MENMKELSELLYNDNFSFWYKLVKEKKLSEELKNSLSNLTYEQLKEVRFGFEAGLSEQQILLYAKREFYYGIMRDIRECFQEGLCVEQVQEFAKYGYDSDEYFNRKRKVCTNILLARLTENLD